MNIKGYIVVSNWNSGVPVHKSCGLPNDWRTHLETLKVAKRGYCK